MVKSFKLKVSLCIGLLFIVPFFVRADNLYQETVFNLDPYYDLTGRKETVAVLQKITDQLYFYVDKEWWNGLTYKEKQNFENSFNSLALEFEGRIYPTLTKTFGFENKSRHGYDSRITILFHPMVSGVGGVTNSGDAYPKLQNPKSNEREMVYLNSAHLGTDDVKLFLAHEFTHLITINQKNLLRGVVEDVWLNEARAEYSATLLGYDDIYKGSNLERRVKDLLSKSTVSLTTWSDRREDYGAVNLFTQYLVDHYGLKILVDSLHSNKVGVESINYVLSQQRYPTDFTQVFSDWLVTLLVNDCSLGDHYCYLNKNLKDFRITPTVYYLPRTETVMSSYYSAAYWTTNWYRFIGAGNNFNLKFEGYELVNFKVPYVLCDLKNKCTVGFLDLDKKQKGEISFADFDLKYNSLTIMPFVFDETFSAGERSKNFAFSWQASVNEKINTDEELIRQLLLEIERLKKEIAALQSINGSTGLSCGSINNNLYFGVNNYSEVSCLQQFLKEQGSDIYPQGLVTGNFLSLTQAAVIRFQEKYANEILAPFGLSKGTGYVGEKTRSKINQLLR